MLTPLRSRCKRLSHESFQVHVSSLRRRRRMPWLVPYALPHRRQTSQPWSDDVEETGSGGAMQACHEKARTTADREELFPEGRETVNFDIRPEAMQRIKRDVFGKRFGRLTALPEAVSVSGHQVKVKFHCDCGVDKFIREDHVKSGRVRSCGCLNSELASARKTVHGCATRKHGKTPEFKVWIGIWQRCTDTRSPVYSRYGGRGITVCERWKTFTNFLADMDCRPTPVHTIERKNNNLGYSPDNCEWATRTVQANNRRSNHLLTLNGVTLSAAEWGRKIGVDSLTLLARSYRGWSDSKTLTTPIRPCHRSK